MTVCIGALLPVYCGQLQSYQYRAIYFGLIEQLIYDYVRSKYQMAYLEEGSEAMVALEAMVDRVGMANVLYALAHICWAKAEHLEDKASAHLWRTGGNNLSSFLLVDSAMTDLQHNQT